MKSSYSGMVQTILGQPLLKRFIVEQEGVTLVEYALLLSLVALAIVGSIVFFGQRLSTSYGNAATPGGGPQQPGAGDPVH